MNTSFLRAIFLFSMAHLIVLTAINANNKDSLQLETIEKLTIFNEIQGESLKSITIITAIDSILLNKKSNNSYPATFLYTAADGKTLERSVKIKPRGKSRRLYCSFPPLKIAFSGKELLKNGLRKKHRSLKLVTHCNDGSSASRNVLKEFLAYKIYNELTDNSLRVQLLKVTYKDTESKKSMNKYAILIEDIDELAERMDSKELEVYGKSFSEFEQNNANIFALFQFMIGNADWKIRVQSNVKFIKSNADSTLNLVPYDFDSSGLVAPKYARPSNHLGLRSVKQRLFMGKFDNKTERQKNITFFNARKKSIYSVVDNFKLLDWRTRKEAKEYLDAFYQIINTREFLDNAIPLGNELPKTSNIFGAMGY